MATKRHFAKRGIKIEALWASDHPDAVDLAKGHGLEVVAPIVIIRDEDGDVIDIWTNYRREAIDLWADSPDLPRVD